MSCSSGRGRTSTSDAHGFWERVKEFQSLEDRRNGRISNRNKEFEKKKMILVSGMRVRLSRGRS